MNLQGVSDVPSVPYPLRQCTYEMYLKDGRVSRSLPRYSHDGFLLVNMFVFQSVKVRLIFQPTKEIM